MRVRFASTVFSTHEERLRDLMVRLALDDEFGDARLGRSERRSGCPLDRDPRQLLASALRPQRGTQLLERRLGLLEGIPGRASLAESAQYLPLNEARAGEAERHVDPLVLDERLVERRTRPVELSLRREHKGAAAERRGERYRLAGLPGPPFVDVDDLLRHVDVADEDERLT